MYSQPYQKQLPMKWYPRLGIYKASNVTFNPITMEAHSYQWWNFVKVIKGKLVFNNYQYSNSTIKHQYKVLRLLHTLNFPNPEIFIECPQGLDNLESAISHYKYKIEKLKEAIQKPKSHANKNAERKVEIHLFSEKIKIVKKLMR